MAIDDDALASCSTSATSGWSWNSAGPALEPLLDALIGAASQATLAEAAGEAAETVWDAALEQELRTGLEDFRERAVEDTPGSCRRSTARSPSWDGRRGRIMSRTR